MTITAIHGKQVPVMILRLTASALPRDGATRFVWQTAAAIDSSRFCAYPVFLMNGPQRYECLNRDGVRATVLHGARFIDFRQVSRLFNMVGRWKIGVIHSNDYKSNLYALLLGSVIPRVKIVTTVHGWVGNSSRGRWYCRLDRRMVGRFDRVVTVSSSLARQLGSGVSHKVQVIPNGVDCGYWSSVCEQKPGAPVVGFSGRISVEKGWDLFVRATVLILRSHPNARFRVAGDGPDFKAMNELSVCLGVASRIEFLGPVDDMRAFYETIDILLAPSRSEGMPIAQLEAGAMGIPVVATNVGGVAELIEHGRNGLLCRPGDIADLALQTGRLIADCAMLANMGDTARTVVKGDFSIERMVHRLQDVYTGMV